MSAFVQTIVVALAVLVAAVYVGRRAWRTLRPRKAGGCESGCGCGDTAAGGDGDWARTH